jgi:hypothetical protein
MNRRICVVVSSALLFASMAFGSTAGAAAPKSGPVKVWVKPSTTGTSVKHPGKVFFTGAIGDYGTSVSTNATGKKTKKGSYKLLTPKQGTILVNGTQLNQALTHAQPTTASKTTCAFVFTASAPITIVKGTGAYVGIGGSVNMVATFAAITPKTKSGSCTMKTSTKPLVSFTSITGSGTVTLP